MDKHTHACAHIHTHNIQHIHKSVRDIVDTGTRTGSFRHNHILSLSLLHSTPSLLSTFQPSLGYIAFLSVHHFINCADGEQVHQITWCTLGSKQYCLRLTCLYACAANTFPKWTFWSSYTMIHLDRHKLCCCWALQDCQGCHTTEWSHWTWVHFEPWPVGCRSSGTIPLWLT